MIKISQEDTILIKNLYLSKRYRARRLLSEFPDKGWELGNINTLLKKIWRMGLIDRQPGSGRPRSVHVNKNIKNVEDLMLSQNAPTDSWYLTWNWHLPIDCAQNNWSRSPAECFKELMCINIV